MAGDGTPLLEVAGLDVAYGSARALSGVGFSLDRGRILGIVGESGSGKSTLIWALTRLLPAQARISAGSVRFAGHDLLALSPSGLRALLGRRISYISQDPMSALNPALTIGQQMMDVLYREAGSRRQKRARVIEALERVSLPDPDARLGMLPHELSGGQRQRVSIAMALLLEPELVIADEPTTALDATLELEIIDLLKRLQQETGCALIFVTHHLGVVATLCQEVLVMTDGEVVESGPVAEVFSRPTHAYTRMLLRCDPAQIPVATRRLPTMTDDLTVPPVIVSGPADRIDTVAPPVLEVEGLDVTFAAPQALPRWLGGQPTQVRALRDVSLRLRRGETLALVGESGSGKTTLARAVFGLAAADTGVIRVGGCRVDPDDPSSLQAVRATSSMMFQDPVGSLSPRVTIGEQILEPLVVQGRRVADPGALLARLLENVGLPAHFARRYPHQLSGGQARRVGVARALALAPTLIVADEPTAGLDVSVQGEVLNLLNEIQERTGVAILLITHNMSVVRHCADHVTVLLRGQVVESRPCAALFESPRHDYTRALIAASKHEIPRHDTRERPHDFA